MKKILLLLAVLSTTAQAQKDLIIFRDGTEKMVQVKQVNSDKTVYLEGKGKKATQQLADNANIYMIKYEKRGNVYFTEDGDRVTGNAVRKVPKGTVVLYLKKGQELLAYDFEMESRIVHYKTEKKKNASVKSIPKSDIFMIRYADGTKDVLIEYAGPVAPIKANSQQSQINSDPLIQEKTVVKERTYPAPATLVLKKDKKKVDVIVYLDNNAEIQYKRASNPDGPMYRQEKKNIKDLEYKE